MKHRYIGNVIAAATAVFIAASCNLSDLRCPAKSITAFSFTNPVATGTIDEREKNITVRVPEATNKKSLIAHFATTGIKVEVGSVIQTSGVTPNDFSDPVRYTVTADNTTGTDYVVTVLSGARAITAFSFTDPAVTGTVDEITRTITMKVPTGTDVKKLVANFTTTGVKVSVGSVTQTSGSTANDFSHPLVYMVTADDGSTADYTVFVCFGIKAITSFSFTDPAATGTIDENAKTISVKVPAGTDVKKLVANFTTTGVKVSIGSAIQTSGSTPNDFSHPLVYTVTADDGSTAAYTVLIHYGTKAITSFYLSNSKLEEMGIIDDSAKTITVQVPAGTDLTSLVATFTTTGVKVSIGSVTQTSGNMPNDFSYPVAYTVTADDGSIAKYTVYVGFYKRCLFFGISADPTTHGDSVLVKKLRSWKYDVTVRMPPSLGEWPEDSFARFDFAFLSESPNSSSYKFLRGHPIPMLNLDAWASDKTTVLNWGKGGSVSNFNPEVCVITGATGHPLTAGFPKGMEFRLADSTLGPLEAVMAFEPAIEVISIAAFKDSLAMVCACAVEKGTLLADSITVTKNRAVTIGIHESAYDFISEAGEMLIRAGIRWILGETERASGE